MFGEILKKLRKDAGMSQEQLGNRIGVSKSTIGMYEQGQRMPQNDSILKELATLFSVSIDYLLGYTVTEKTAYDLGIEKLSLKEFPMLGSIACGVPIDCVESTDVYKCGSDDIRADFCLTARGDSMINAQIFDGDTIYIRQQSMVVNGEIAAVVLDGSEVTLKRFFYYPEKHQVILQPENPLYHPIIFSDSDLDSICILGKAVAVTHHL